jgi:hypothetical protein
MFPENTGLNNPVLVTCWSRTSTLQRMTTFALDQRERGEIGAVVLFIVNVRLPRHHPRSYSLCSFVVHQFITQFSFH